MGLMSLSDEELEVALKRYVAAEKEELANIIEHLVEFDGRRLALRKGFPSLFKYCTAVLGYAESAAYKRINCVRAVERFPSVLDLLREGLLHLEAVPILSPHLNNDVMLRIAFTASQDCFAKVERARELLRHKFPFGQLEAIFDQALEDLLDKRDPERRLRRRQAERREQAGRSEAGRRIPQRVKDEVWQRDAGRCVFSGADGQRCGERSFLEYDHVIPYALGGRSDTPKNVRLLCRAHNQEASRRVFGEGGLSGRRSSALSG